MDKPIIKLVDFNKQKPNLQSKGFTADGIPNGRIIASIKDVNLNGWKPKGVWNWVCSWENFKLGTLEDHDETWGDEDEHRKLGGMFPNGYDSVVFNFKVSRLFYNDSESRIFTYDFQWTQSKLFIEIADDEIIDPPPVPDDCKDIQDKYDNVIIKNIALNNEIAKIKIELKEVLEMIDNWKFFNKKDSFPFFSIDFMGFWHRKKGWLIAICVAFIIGLIL